MQRALGLESNARLSERGSEQGACPRVWLAVCTSPCDRRTDNAPRGRFSVTLGQEPEVEVALVWLLRAHILLTVLHVEDVLRGWLYRTRGAAWASIPAGGLCRMLMAIHPPPTRASSDPNTDPTTENGPEIRTA